MDGRYFMQIEHIEIVNFKGIIEEKFSFKSGVNLIIGDNGTGKTSVLEAVSVALGAFLAGINEVRGVHFSKDEIRRENELLGEGSNNIKYKTPVKVTCDIKIGDQNFHFIRQKKSVKSSRSTVEPRDICKASSRMAEDSTAVLPVISYQGISRISNQKREGWVDVFKNDFSRVVAYMDCLSEISNMKQMTNWFARMEQISWQQDKKIAEYEIVKRAVNIFMGEMLGENTVRVFYDKRTEELMYENGTEVLPIRLLSSGFRTLVGMVLDIAYRMAILNPFLLDKILKETPGIVLVDEIDMHLHPKWQWNVVKALKKTFPKVQFIVTTHSPIIVASCKNENLISLNHKTELADNMYGESLEGWQVDDVLQKVMQTGNRAPETLKQLEVLKALSRKKKTGALTKEELEQYENIKNYLRAILPESDTAIEEVTMMTIYDMLKENECEK